MMVSERDLRRLIADRMKASLREENVTVVLCGALQSFCVAWIEESNPSSAYHMEGVNLEFAALVTLKEWHIEAEKITMSEIANMSRLERFFRKEEINFNLAWVEELEHIVEKLWNQTPTLQRSLQALWPNQSS